MNRRSRGAASVSLVWVVVLLVLMLGAGATAYVFATDSAKWQQQLATAKQEKDAADAKFMQARTQLLDITKQVGFADENNPGAYTNPEQLSGRIKQLQDTYKDVVGVNATNAARVMERLQTQIDELTRQLAEAKTQTQTAEQGRVSLQTNLADVQRQRDEAYSELQKQLQSEIDRNAGVEQNDKTRIDDLTRRVADFDARTKADKDASDKAIGELNAAVQLRDARIAELAKKVEVIRLPDEPDGKVVAVSNANTCYVDLGARQLLRRGTRFKVFSYGKNGAMREKGMIEVTKVDEEMAEATIVDLKDRFDPMTKGDSISAPNYDPEMPREFVLVGRFPTGYSRPMVADRLRALGATVKEKVGPATDFLVLGDKDESGAVTGMAAEGDESAAAEGGGGDAMGEAERLASLYRVQIIPAREILDYLKYE